MGLYFAARPLYLFQPEYPRALFTLYIGYILMNGWGVILIKKRQSTWQLAFHTTNLSIT